MMNNKKNKVNLSVNKINSKIQINNQKVSYFLNLGQIIIIAMIILVKI